MGICLSDKHIDGQAKCTSQRVENPDREVFLAILYCG